VKAHDDSYGSELADHLAKEGACGSDIDITYIKTPKSTVTSELKEKCVQVWHSEWDASNKGGLTRTFFPVLKDRILKRLQMCINIPTIVTRHSIMRSYFHRFKFIEDLTCLCKKSPQTTDFLLWECKL
jgi:hypothetical protein